MARVVVRNRQATVDPPQSPADKRTAPQGRCKTGWGNSCTGKALQRRAQRADAITPCRADGPGKAADQVQATCALSARCSHTPDIPRVVIDSQQPDRRSFST